MYPTTRVNTLPIRERPTERIAAERRDFSVTELLAALFGGQYQLEIAEVLLDRFGSLHHMSGASTWELASIPGIGDAKAVRLKAALELARRFMDPQETQPSIHAPHDAASILMRMLTSSTQEMMGVLCLNMRNRVIREIILYKGTVNSAKVRPAEVIRPAIQINAPAIIIGHSHPSGSTKPSPDDILITRDIVKSGKIMEIQVLDHLIVVPNDYSSLRKDHQEIFTTED